MSGSIEGKLTIRLAPHKGHAEIKSSRPLLASRVFESKTVDETIRLLPMLFNVCGQAQAIACVRAIESAVDTPATRQIECLRDKLGQIETLREHLWRILFDWPGFCNDKPDPVAAAHTMSLVQKLRSTLDAKQQLCTTPGLRSIQMPNAEYRRLVADFRTTLETTVFGMDLETWLDLDPTDLLDWTDETDSAAARLLACVHQQNLRDIGRTSTAAMPDLNASDLVSLLDSEQAEDFISQPQWQDAPMETGVMVRQQDHPMITGLKAIIGQGLLVRLVARLVEVAEISLQLLDESDQVNRFSQAPGLSQLEAARGRLCHRVVLDGSRISRYRILAPTEWNFRPGGVAQQALSAINTEDAAYAEYQAKLLIHAIDPCVGYDLHLETA